MLSQILRNSFRLLAPAALALVLPGVCAAQAPAQSPQPGPTVPGADNPTKPEVQPSLDQDHDPIPSPDIVVPETSTSNNVPAGKGQLQRQSNGVYTMNVDVDEVLLPCAVVDDKGRPVVDHSVAWYKRRGCRPSSAGR